MAFDPNMLAQVQQMQQRLAKAQEDLMNEVVTGSAGGGVVTVSMNGQHHVSSVTIDPEVVDPYDVATLQDMVLSAFNNAVELVQKNTAEKMRQVTGGMNLPGF